jgi:hypothetical protein
MPRREFKVESGFRIFLLVPVLVLVLELKKKPRTRTTRIERPG